MPSLDVTLLFLVVPVGAFGLMAVSVLNAAAHWSSQGVRPASQESKGRILVLLTGSASTVVFGFVSWTLLNGIEGNSGVLASRDANLVFWLGTMWAWVSVTSIAVQGWILRSRVGELVGPNFGRVLIAVVIPLTPVVFALVIVLQVLARVPLTTAVPDSRIDAVVTSLVLFALSSLALPATASVANRVRDLAAPRNFRRVLLLGNLAELPVIAGLMWAILQIGSL